MTSRAALEARIARLLADALVRELRAEDNGTSERPDTVTSGAGRVPTRAREAPTENDEHPQSLASA